MVFYFTCKVPSRNYSYEMETINKVDGMKSSVWEYIDGDDVLLGYGSAALSGWKRPLDPIFPPTLKRIMNEENRMKFSGLASLLFDHSKPLTKVPNIKGLMYTMLATQMI
jgi:hypothetical protein